MENWKMKPLPSPDQLQKENNDQYLQVLLTLDPDLYKIKLYLEEYKVNPMIICRIIRALGNVNVVTGYGVISILIKSRTVTQIKGGESDVLNLPLGS